MDIEKRYYERVLRLSTLAIAVTLLAGCGSEKDSSDSETDNGNTQTYTVTPSASVNGTIMPDTAQIIDQNDTKAFTLTPDSGYAIASVTGCDGNLDGDTYTTGAVIAACTVNVSFESVQVPAEPSFSLAPESIKSFQFNWSAVDGATEYNLMEDPDSQSGYTEVASFDATTTSHALQVSLPKRINARYILEACINEVCTDSAPVHVEGSLVDAAGYFKASNTEDNDNFGYSVALSGDGNTLAVGARHEDSGDTGVDGNQVGNSHEKSGAVYVFSRNGATWSQQEYIKASNAQEGDVFGWAVALSDDGDTLAVGAVGEDSNATGVCAPGAVCDTAQADDSFTSSGAAYVFTRSGTTWSQQAYIKASNTDSQDEFATALALSGDGNTLAVGAINEDSDDISDQSNNDATKRGAVYVFIRSGASWSQQAYVKSSRPEPPDFCGCFANTNDRFGGSVALAGDGNTLAVGANGEDSNVIGIDGDQQNDDVGNSGAVYVFIQSGGNWSQQAYVKPSNTGQSDFFGTSVALSGDGSTLAVGASNEASGATGINGPQSDVAGFDNSGAVYVFTRNTVAWSQQAYIKASNTGLSDFFGTSVALSVDGNTLAVGAQQEGSDATGIGGDENNDDGTKPGAAYLFSRTGTSWSQQAYIKGLADRPSNYFGKAVSMSSDGNSLAVGAYEESGSETGVGGDPEDTFESGSGAVLLY